MNRKSLQTLEYEKIRDRLTAFAGCAGSSRMAESLVPFEALYEVREGLQETTEARRLLNAKGALPTAGMPEEAARARMARKGLDLSMKDLLQIARALRIADDVHTFMRADDLPDVPRIRELTSLVIALPGLRTEIERCILTEDEMADNASPVLRDLRRSIARQNESIRARLSQMITSQANRTFLQDAIVTTRDGRYVIPVKTAYRAQVPGMIHDQSRGGATLFIEPQVIVDMNNRLRELEVAEKAEVARILAELSSRVGEHATEIESNERLIARLDFMMAKGRLSEVMDGEEPEVTESGVLRLDGARHPLIDQKSVVPVDILLGEGCRTLIITGPNTGGKTVSLKTAGLLSLMAESGLHIPARSTSTIPFFKEIYADIGDEQSIEQSLSTFSSHIKNIAGILQAADAQALVLFDELGAGTDPAEGAALGIAILERVQALGALTMATTHYSEIKKYALQTPGIQNAAMEFNVDTLSPTYRLLTGVPGSSNAFAISRKLGLADAVIARATELMDAGDLAFEHLLASIEEDKARAASDRLEAASLLEKAREETARVREEERRLEEKKEKLLAGARAEARDLIRAAEEETREVQEELRSILRAARRNGAEAHIPTDGIARGKKRLKEVEAKYARKRRQSVRQIESPPVDSRTLKKGDRVKILSINRNGEVETLPDDKGNLKIAVGALKIESNIRDLMLINEGKARKKTQGKTQYGGLYRHKAGHVAASIDVRGKNLEDALMDIEKYLDDVYIAGLDKVTIIHGRGEGVLRQGIRQALRRNKFVASFSAGVYNEGGEGVTLVTMKQT